jgi:hypothetical protein
LKMLYSSVIAGVSVAIVFSLAIFGATRASDMRRDNKTGAATGYAALAGISLALAMGIVIYGVALVVHKS